MIKKIRFESSTAGNNGEANFTDLCQSMGGGFFLVAEKIEAACFDGQRDYEYLRNHLEISPI
jgi:hypothetical protein